MINTMLLATFFGIYLITKACFVLARPKAAMQIVEYYKKNIILVYSLGFFAFFIGLILVIFHNQWASPVEILVSLLCWAVLGKGVAAIFFPDALIALAEKFANKQNVFVSGVWALAIGLFVIFFSRLQI